jgi:hypothetical protein
MQHLSPELAADCRATPIEALLKEFKGQFKA